MSDMWWQKTSGSALSQGDLLEDCRWPTFANPKFTHDNSLQDLDVKCGRLIVVTQSCDLENNKVEFVALCVVNGLGPYAEITPHFQNLKSWEPVRQGKRPALHMLASPDNPGDKMASLIVDFGQIISLPIEYLMRHAESLGQRDRLASPYLEHFSQALARFFMRVGLPSSIPSFTKS